MRAKVISTEGVLVLKVPYPSLDSISKMGEEVDIDIKKHREKRSRDANAYMWQLCDKIAESIGSTKEEIYRIAISRVGVFKDYWTLDSTLRTAWEGLGTGWIVEDCDGYVRCYYGSSTYNTKQMSRLIDYIVDEAQELGIETLTPAELEAMKAQWQGRL